jgi:uncharacterized membrane protein
VLVADVSALLARWTAAGLIDDALAARIQAHEREHAGTNRQRWPIAVALASGALLVGTGVLLFVSAHWDTLSPSVRFTLVVLLVAGFHVAAAVVGERFSAMATTLHTVGTVSLGAGIFLSGQIFNLDEHWPGGVMVWALGAAAGAVLLCDWPQFALAAILVPVWLGAEWYVAAIDRNYWSGHRILAAGSVLLALTYFTAAVADRRDTKRRVLMWIGGLALAPAAIALASVSSNEGGWRQIQTMPAGLGVLGWTMALGLPLAGAAGLRRGAAWLNGVAALWTIVLVTVYPIAGEVPLYFWWAVGAGGLVAWGVHERRPERINMGAAAFAATVIAFYFSEVMDKLGRSMSLVGLGVLFLAGGWALERTRRRLIGQTQEPS